MNKKKNALSVFILFISLYLLHFLIPESDDYHDVNLEQLIQREASGVHITIEGYVVKILKDDVDGIKHQKMILRVGTNTVLLAHNIDLAQRIPARVGDRLMVKGDYEWNDKGGIIHWTHKDYKNKHKHGWVILNNKKYH